MSYRIVVEPEALSPLRTLAGHVLQRIGRVLAEIAAHASVAQPPSLVFARQKGSGAALLRLEVADCRLYYRVDKRAETITVVEVGQFA